MPADTEPEETPDEKRERILRSLNITSPNHTFENFEVVTGTAASYTAMKEMVTGHDHNALLVYGSVGNGKTYLAEALSRELYNRGIWSNILIWSEFCRQLKRLMFRREPDEPSNYDGVFERTRRLSHLIIDDVGMGTQGTEWEWGELEDIISYRYRQWPKLFTVMMTNLDIKQIPERIVRRFRDPEWGKVVHNAGKDYPHRK